MYVVRAVFRAKPGKSGALAAKFKAAAPLFAQAGAVSGTRVMTDVSAGFWSVVVENTTESLDSYLDMATAVSQNPEIGKAMEGYHDLVLEGYREIFQLV